MKLEQSNYFDYKGMKLISNLFFLSSRISRQFVLLPRKIKVNNLKVFSWRKKFLSQNGDIEQLVGCSFIVFKATEMWNWNKLERTGAQWKQWMLSESHFSFDSPPTIFHSYFAGILLSSYYQATVPALFLWQTRW